MGEAFDGAERGRQEAGVPDRILPAISFRLISVMAFATMGALIKLAERHGAHLAELLFFRQALALPVVLAAVITGPGLTSLRTQRLPAHLLRTVVGLSSMSCMFLSLMTLQLAEATTLQFSMPIFATILGALVLREPTGIHRWGAVVIGFLGILIVTQPGSSHIPLIGAIFGLAAAMLSASVSILLRRIGRTELATTTVFYFSVLSLLPLGTVWFFNVQGHPPITWGLLVLIGLTGGVGQLAMTRSLAIAPVAVTLPMDYFSLLWATLYGWVLFSVLPTPMTWVGAPIIIASGLYIVWREHRRAQENTSGATPQ
jgi:drug/metabolite transporter (DMT)-like permease